MSDKNSEIARISYTNSIFKKIRETDIIIKEMMNKKG